MQKKKVRQIAHKRTMIWVTFQKEGIHCFPAALTDPRYKTGDQYDVSYLCHPHRHMFHFKVAISVEHNDREIEFIQFKRWLISLYDTGALDLQNQSCEMIAMNLYATISKRYSGRAVDIEVSEDNENGCVISWR